MSRWVVLILGISSAGPVSGQNSALRFEVTSVKANKTATSIWNHFGPASIQWTGVPLKDLIGAVYGLQNYQIAGAPGWTASDRWDVEGKSDAPADHAAKTAMMKALLAERFQLMTHSETRDLPQYRLEVAKGGPRMRRADARDLAGAGMHVETGLLEGRQTSMANLAFWLKNQLGLPVLDNTGLKGNYTFRLEWLPDESQPNSGGDLPPVVTAVQGLGLRLIPFKGPVEVMVVDQVEKPTGN